MARLSTEILGLDISKMQVRFFVSSVFDYQRTAYTVFPRFSAPGRLPIFQVFVWAVNRAGALIKTYEN